MSESDTTRSAGGATLELMVAPMLASLSGLRRSLSARLDGLGLRDQMIGDVILVASELVVNAINASHTDEPVRVRVAVDDDGVAVEVENAGPPFYDDAVARRAAAGGDTEGGRGMVIVFAVADSVTLRFRPGRCVVHAVICR